jgi:hypothetical protein
VAGNQLRINGIEELRKALLELPKQLVAESAAIVQAQGAEAMRQIEAAYPKRSGNLADGLRLEIRRDAASAGASVKNIARFRRGPWAAGAWIFEKGSGPRQWASGKKTGKMPAGHVFIPIAMQRRRIMTAALVDLVERAGLHVTGTA